MESDGGRGLARRPPRLADSGIPLMWFAERDHPSRTVVLPRASAFVSVCLGRSPDVDVGGRVNTSPSVSINGLVDGEPVELDVPAKMRVVGIDLGVVGLHRLTGLPAHDFVNRHVDVADVLGADVASTLRDRAGDAVEPSGCLDAVEDVLAANLREFDESSTTSVERVLRVIASSVRRPDLDRLSRESLTSSRSLQRHFRHVVGVSIRTWIGRHRFALLCDGLRSGRWSSSEAAAFELGFHDAAHLRRFVGGHTGRPAGEVFGLLAGRCDGLDSDIIGDRSSRPRSAPPRIRP